MRAALAAVAVSLLASACGARTGLGAASDASVGAAASPNCGARRCDLARQYCYEDLLSTTYQCLPLPAACASDGSCACLEPVVPRPGCVVFRCGPNDAGVDTIMCASG